MSGLRGGWCCVRDSGGDGVWKGHSCSMTFFLVPRWSVRVYPRRWHGIFSILDRPAEPNHSLRRDTPCLADRIPTRMMCQWTMRLYYVRTAYVYITGPPPSL